MKPWHLAAGIDVWLQYWALCYTRDMTLWQAFLSAFIWKKMAEWLSTASDLAQPVKAISTKVPNNVVILIMQMSSTN